MDLYEVWVKCKRFILKQRMLFVCLILFLLFIIQAIPVLLQQNKSYTFSQSDFVSDTPEGRINNYMLKDNTSELFNAIRTPEITLKKGLYIISVTYESENGGTICYSGNGRDARSFWFNDISLITENTHASSEYWANDEINNFGVIAISGGGTFQLKSVSFTTAWNSKLYQLTCIALKVILLALICFFLLYRDALQKYTIGIAGILGITFICSIGLFTRYMITGHDLVFHLNRIEGLKDGLLAGMIPVRVQPTWNNGWGYAVSLMYGDTALLLPAIMRIIGFTIQTSWKTYIVVVNFLTAVISYYCFHKIAKDKYKALFATLLYCAGLYRLFCIYIRAAVGEYTVMMFLPLVVLGFWYAFHEDVDSPDYGKKLLAPVLGFTGMLQTHMLTCEISAVFIILLCIIFIKKVIRRKTFTYLAKIVLYTIPLNLWFLVPFLSMYKEELEITQPEKINTDFQMWGLSITELFATTATSSSYFTFADNVSLANKCTVAVGLALWIGIFLSLIFFLQKKVNNRKAIGIMIAFSILAIFMTTNLFPYRDMMLYTPMLYQFLSQIRLSFRFLGVATLFMTLGVFLTVCSLKDGKWMKYAYVFIAIVSTIAIWQGMNYQYQVLYGESKETRYSTAALNNADVVGGEYLYLNSSIDVTYADQKVTGAQVDIKRTESYALTTVVTCKATEENASIEIPKFYYPGYVAKDESGNYYRVTRSTNNNRIHVDLPKSFDGKLTVFYREPLYWRICEIISIITLVGFILWRWRIECNVKNKQ